MAGGEAAAVRRRMEMEMAIVRIVVKCIYLEEGGARCIGIRGPRIDG